MILAVDHYTIATFTQEWWTANIVSFSVIALFLYLGKMLDSERRVYLTKFIAAILILRVLLSWFPNLDWSNPFLSSISSITDPYLNAFRGIIPPIGGIDLSAILAFIVLGSVNRSISCLFIKR